MFAYTSNKIQNMYRYVCGKLHKNDEKVKNNIFIYIQRDILC